MNLKIVFFGTPDFVVSVLKTLEENFEVVAVVTSPEGKVPSPVAQNFNGKVLRPERLDESFVSELESLNADLYVVSGYGKIIPKRILELPKYGSINIHPSLLPKFRGPTPVQAAILAGEKVSGVTIIKMDEKMDHGPILASKELEILTSDTSESFYDKAFKAGADLLIEILPDFLVGKLNPREQDESEATFCKMITKEDGFFEIDNPPNLEMMDRMIRAYYPWPNVWTKWNGKVVKFYPGKMVQMEGKKITSLADFLNGYPDFPIKQI